METKFTKGKWHNDGLSIISVSESNQYHVADVTQRHPFREPSEEELANAHLIASSPQLYEELDNMCRAYVRLLEVGRDRISDLGGQCDPLDVMESQDHYLKWARAALKAARGEQ